MEDATKTWPYLRPGVGRQADPVSDSDIELEPNTEQVDLRSTGQKTLERWFLEERGGKRVPKRLDIANEVLVTSGGPLKMTGNITLIDESGHVTHANQMDLCRCGKSRNGPMCDNTHLDTEFLDKAAISQASDCLPLKRPQTVTITCVKDGPLKFRGYLRVFNRKGQECVTMQGLLCRCGKSSKKPFCDCA